jgi:hypothetical protein
MRFPTSNSRQLLNFLDVLIDRHGAANPALLRDLLALRSALQEAMRTNRIAEVAKVSLRIALWVKFIYDLL